MRIVITGGNGFIGSHLADRLQAMGHQISLFDICFGKNTAHLDCQKLRGDVCEGVQNLPNNPDLVFHFAAVSRVEWGEADPQKCLRTNIQGPVNVIQWVLGAETKPHLIFASSREVYGESTSLPVTEEHPKRPLSVYGVSKLAVEQLLAHFARTSGLQYTIVRFSNVYGSPRDLPERVIPRFTQNAMLGKPLILNGGNQVLDFTFVDEVIEGLVNLTECIQHRNLQVFNTDFQFTSERGTSIKELAGLIKAATRSRSEIVAKPERTFDVMKFVGSSSKAKRFLGYASKVTIEEGLSRYVERIHTESE